MSEKVLVVAAHPDDEIIGLGGTLARHAKSGDIIKTLIIGEGGTSRVPDYNDNEILEVLKSSAKNAAVELGVDPPIMLNLPDNRLDSQSLIEIIKPIEEILDNFNPDVVYTHFHSDLNIDHRITSDSVLTACRPMPNTSVKRLYLFETLSSTEWSFGRYSSQFSPQRYVDISDSLEKKISAFSQYKTEVKEFPHPRSLESIRSLAKLRGSQVGMIAAEAFEVVFERI